MRIPTCWREVPGEVPDRGLISCASEWLLVRACPRSSHVRPNPDNWSLKTNLGRDLPLRLDASYRPRVVSGLVSGLHVPGESHFELLSAFAPAERLRDALALAARHGLSSHELGDACLIMHAVKL